MRARKLTVQHGLASLQSAILPPMLKHLPACVAAAAPIWGAWTLVDCGMEMTDLGMPTSVCVCNSCAH